MIWGIVYDCFTHITPNSWLSISIKFYQYLLNGHDLVMIWMIWGTAIFIFSQTLWLQKVAPSKAAARLAALEVRPGRTAAQRSQHMVLHGSHQYTPVMLALIYQHHGSYGYGFTMCIMYVYIYIYYDICTYMLLVGSLFAGNKPVQNQWEVIISFLCERGLIFKSKSNKRPEGIDSHSMQDVKELRRCIQSRN